MDNQIKVSVIIPAYNCEKGLSRAVQSVPDDNNVEVLIVENGSTDATLQIAHQLGQKRSNVRVLNSDKGVSEARNKGLDSARGKKVLFLDADDYYLSILKSEIQEVSDNDLSIYSFESGSTEIKLFADDTVITGKAIDALKGRMLESPTSFLTVWGKIFDLRIIKNNELRFDSSLRLSEDSFFLIQYLKFCSQIGCYSGSLYHYSRDSGSTVRSFNVTTTNDYIKSLEAVEQFIKLEEPQLVHHYYQYGAMQLNLIGVHGIFDVHNPMPFFKKVKLLKQIVKRPVIKECLEKLNLRDMKSLKYIAVILIKTHMFWLAGLVFKFRSYTSA